MILEGVTPRSFRSGTERYCMSHFPAKSSIFFYNVEAGADLITLWIACLKPNLGFLANLNPFLKIYDDSIYWGFLILLKVSNQIQMGSFRSTTLFGKSTVRKRRISSSNVLHVVKRLEIQPGGRSLMVWRGSPRCGSRHLAQRCQVRTPGSQSPCLRESRPATPD